MIWAEEEERTGAIKVVRYFSREFVLQPILLLSVRVGELLPLLHIIPGFFMNLEDGAVSAENCTRIFESLHIDEAATLGLAK